MLVDDKRIRVTRCAQTVNALTPDATSLAHLLALAPYLILVQVFWGGGQDGRRKRAGSRDSGFGNRELVTCGVVSTGSEMIRREGSQGFVDDI
jgi:hypothetical protein